MGPHGVRGNPSHNALCKFHIWQQAVCAAVPGSRLDSPQGGIYCESRRLCQPLELFVEHTGRRESLGMNGEASQCGKQLA